MLRHLRDSWLSTDWNPHPISPEVRQAMDACFQAVACSYLRLFLSYENNQINKLLMTSNESFFKFTASLFLAYLDPSTPNGLDPDQAAVLASCQDLLLCRRKLSFEHFYYICNPFVGKWNELSPRPSHDENTRLCFICKGRGSKFTYTVIRFLCSGDSVISPELAVETYSSGIDTWRKKMVSPRLGRFRWPILNCNAKLWWQKLYQFAGIWRTMRRVSGACNINSISEDWYERGLLGSKTRKTQESWLRSWKRRHCVWL